MEKTDDDKKSLKITIKAPVLKGHTRAKITEESTRLPKSS
jgi:hypothetical protein